MSPWFTATSLSEMGEAQPLFHRGAEVLHCTWTMDTNIFLHKFFPVIKFALKSDFAVPACGYCAFDQSEMNKSAQALSDPQLANVSLVITCTHICGV